MSKNTPVIGVPRIRVQSGTLELLWENELARVVACGTNHQANRILQSLNLNRRISHLKILRQTDKEVLAMAADHNRQYLNRLPCLAGLPREEMQKDLTWMDESAWLQAPEQLSRESLWQFLSWGARFHHPDQDPADVLHQQMCRMAGYFGIIDIDSLKKLRERYAPSKDNDGWYSPLRSPDSRIVCLNTGTASTDSRILCVMDSNESWSSWGLGEHSPIHPNLRCIPLQEGQGMSALSEHISEHMQNSRRWYQSKKLFVDTLASMPTAFGVRSNDPHLTGLVRLGKIEEHLAQVLHNQTPTPADWHRRVLDTTRQDYNNEHALRQRAREQGVDPEQDSLREKIARRSLEEHSWQQAVWNRPLNSCQKGEAPEEAHTGKLEALTCQSLPSGLIHPSLPGQPSRLHGTLAASLLYRPLNPFAPDSTTSS